MTSFDLATLVQRDPAPGVPDWVERERRQDEEYHRERLLNRLTSFVHAGSGCARSEDEALGWLESEGHSPEDAAAWLADALAVERLLPLTDAAGASVLVPREDRQRFEAGVTESRERRSRLGLLSLQQLGAASVRVPLVEGIFAMDTLSFLYGRPTAYKSFIAQGIALAVATGTPWQGRAVKPGAVLYIAAEGGSGLGSRFGALTTQLGIDPATASRFTLKTQRVDLLDGEEVAELLALVRELRPALIVVDTLARCNPRGDENGTGSSGALESLDSLRRATGACVLILHHPPRSSDHLRGWYGLEGNADTVVRAARFGDNVTLTSTKDKEGWTFEPFTLRLVEVEGTGSAVLVPVDQAAPATRSTGQRAEAIVNALRSGPLNLSQIERAVQGNSTALRRELTRLVEDGTLVETAAGKARVFALSDRPEPARSDS